MSLVPARAFVIFPPSISSFLAAFTEGSILDFTRSRGTVPLGVAFLSNATIYFPCRSKTGEISPALVFSENAQRITSLAFGMPMMVLSVSFTLGAWRFETPWSEAALSKASEVLFCPAKALALV